MQDETPQTKHPELWKALFRFVVIAHMVMLVIDLAALFVVPFLAPWYIAAPVFTYLINLMLNRHWSCPMTDLENKIRAKLGYKKIGGFVGHYFKRPIATYLGWRKKPTLTPQEIGIQNEQSSS